MTETHLHVACDAPIGPLHLRLDESLAAPWTVLFGPSGSGKSTVLRLIAGLWSSRGAAVRFGAEELTRLPAHRRRIGMVAQQTALFPHLTVRENVAFGCDRDEQVRSTLESFHLTPLASKYPAALSGGEQQRVAIARALAAKPRLLLLDEAFTGMHRAQQSELILVVREHSVRHAMPVLSVTHDVAEAFSCGDEVLRMEAGRIVGRGPAQEALAEERDTLLVRLRSHED